MIPHDIHRVISVLAIEFYGPVWCDAVRRQKGDYIAGATGCQIGIADLFQLGRTDSRYFQSLLPGPEFRMES